MSITDDVSRLQLVFKRIKFVFSFLQQDNYNAHTTKMGAVLP